MKYWYCDTFCIWSPVNIDCICLVWHWMVIVFWGGAGPIALQVGTSRHHPQMFVLSKYHKCLTGFAQGDTPALSSGNISMQAACQMFVALLASSSQEQMMVKKSLLECLEMLWKSFCSQRALTQSLYVTVTSQNENRVIVRTLALLKKAPDFCNPEIQDAASWMWCAWRLWFWGEPYRFIFTPCLY